MHSITGNGGKPGTHLTQRGGPDDPPPAVFRTDAGQTRPAAYSAIALAISTETPGPIVDDSEIFFR